MTVQFCPKCGAILAPGTAKCPQCGTAIAAPASPDAVTPKEYWMLVRTVLVPVLAFVAAFIVLIVILVALFG